MTANAFDSFRQAYLLMAPSYRPAAPGDGMGHVLRSPGARGFQAYDAAGQLIGSFHDKQAAIAAITAPNSTGDTNGNERATKAA